jgi:hypothetical protein
MNTWQRQQQQPDEDEKKALELFNFEGENNKIPNNKLVIYANYVDIFYNYFSGSDYHNKHFTADDIENIQMNTPGLVAAHMFAEYKMYKDKDRRGRRRGG